MTGSPSGLPAYGSCAGMILLADRIEGGTADQQTIGGLDVTVRRNAFGRQVDSFETDLVVAASTTAASTRCTRCSSGRRGSSRPDPVSRCSPRSSPGPAAGRIVAVRERDVLATSFHPEVTGDLRLHRLFVQIVEG